LKVVERGGQELDELEVPLERFEHPTKDKDRNVTALIRSVLVTHESITETMGSLRKVSGMIVAWEGCVLEEKKLHALEVPP
jgi:hypothetical protein